jgi:hypothetical protein
MYENHYNKIKTENGLEKLNIKCVEDKVKLLYKIRIILSNYLHFNYITL